MTERLVGTRFLVTGAAGGIGRATARLLIQRGAQVILWDADAERLGETAQALASAFTVVDVTKTEQVEQAAARIITNSGRLDGVIHCAGVARVGMFEQISLDDHRLVVEANLFGTLALAHKLLPYLKESRGSLVLLASVAGFYGPPEFAEAILRGIERRQFMIYVGWWARLIFIMSRYLHLLAHAIMMQTWRSGEKNLSHAALPGEYPSES